MKTLNPVSSGGKSFIVSLLGHCEANTWALKWASSSCGNLSALSWTPLALHVSCPLCCDTSWFRVHVQLAWLAIARLKYKTRVATAAVLGEVNCCRFCQFSLPSNGCLCAFFHVVYGSLNLRWFLSSQTLENPAFFGVLRPHFLLPALRLSYFIPVTA